jgi:hypothetical protein
MSTENETTEETAASGASGAHDAAADNGAGAEARPMNRAERRAMGKKGGQPNQGFGHGGGFNAERLRSGPSADKSRFNRKVGGK